MNFVMCLNWASYVIGCGASQITGTAAFRSESGHCRQCQRHRQHSTGTRHAEILERKTSRSQTTGTKNVVPSYTCTVAVRHGYTCITVEIVYTWYDIVMMCFGVIDYKM